ncbi:MAG: hypothetical protein ACAH59_07710 [Pseudobdellovibrionaceae bacterium]
MKKRLLAAAFILSATTTQAATYGRENNVTALLGFTQTAMNFGANYERRLDTMGVGGYFHFSSEEKDNQINRQTMSFGAMAPAHVLDDNRFDIYLAPGFGVTMIKGVATENDETVFGPTIKTGMLFKFTPTVKAGIEHFYFTNWFNDKAQASGQYTNAALSFAF